jgi:hypothetical protein
MAKKAKHSKAEITTKLAQAADWRRKENCRERDWTGAWRKRHDLASLAEDVAVSAGGGERAKPT